MSQSSVQRRVEAVSGMIVRIVNNVIARTPRVALEATGRQLYVDDDVVATMPKGAKGKAPVYFFKPDPSAYDVNGLISDDNVEKEFDRHGLKPVDPYRLAAVNEADPAFADEHPNATHWKGADGKWCYAAFYRWGDGGRSVRVDRDDYDWGGHWWFAGCRK